MGRLSNLRPGLLPPPSRVSLPPKVVEAFYQSREWRMLVARLKRERGDRCEEPGCGSSERIIGDHIVERRDGGAELDPANVRLLCFTHHQRKTAKARARRARGQA